MLRGNRRMAFKPEDGSRSLEVPLLESSAMQTIPSPTADAMCAFCFSVPGCSVNIPRYVIMPHCQVGPNENSWTFVLEVG